MGYDTEFRGEFAVEPPLLDEPAAYREAFNEQYRAKVHSLSVSMMAFRK